MSPGKNPALHFKESRGRNLKLDRARLSTVNDLRRMPLSFRDPIGNFLFEEQPDGLRLAADESAERCTEQSLWVEIGRQFEPLASHGSLLDSGDRELPDIGVSAMGPEQVPLPLQVGHMVRIDHGGLALS